MEKEQIDIKSMGDEVRVMLKYFYKILADTINIEELYYAVHNSCLYYYIIHDAETDVVDVSSMKLYRNTTLEDIISAKDKLAQLFSQIESDLMEIYTKVFGREEAEIFLKSCTMTIHDNDPNVIFISETDSFEATYDMYVISTKTLYRELMNIPTDIIEGGS